MDSDSGRAAPARKNRDDADGSRFWLALHQSGSGASTEILLGWVSVRGRLELEAPGAALIRSGGHKLSFLRVFRCASVKALKLGVWQASWQALELGRVSRCGTDEGNTTTR